MPEGDWRHCPTCGKNARLDPCEPLGDAVCPACGSLITAPPETSPLETEGIDRPRPLLQLSYGDPAETYTFSQPQILIGRRTTCDLHLSASNISSHHCVIKWLSGHWLVHDLQSTNGTKVNGTRIKSAILRNGDRLTVAKTSIQVEIVAANA